MRLPNEFIRGELEGGEGEGEEGADGGEAVDGVAADKEDFDGGAGEDFVLHQGLAAGAAGRDGVGKGLSIGAAGGDGYGFEAGVGVFGVGIEAGGALGAGAAGIGNVFLVGAGNDGAVAEANGGADAEVAIGGIAAEGCPTGEVNELLLGGGEFGGRENFVVSGYLFFHGVFQLFVWFGELRGRGRRRERQRPRLCRR